MNYVQRLKDFFAESKRVLRVTKKPTKDEYWTITKVSAIGILIIGAIGFVLHLINQFLYLVTVMIIVVILVLGLIFLKRE